MSSNDIPGDVSGPEESCQAIEESESIQELMCWDEPALYYPAGTGTCQICNEPELPLVESYPDVVSPPDPVPICLDCLSRLPDDWELLGELILEMSEIQHDDVDPGYGAWVAFDLPDEFNAIPAPGYEPWDEVSVSFDSDVNQVPASRSPFETKTVPSVDIGGNPRLVVNGFELEYDGYVPVDTESWSEDVSMSYREPDPDWEEY